jgi:hypothetical protein
MRVLLTLTLAAFTTCSAVAQQQNTAPTSSDSNSTSQRNFSTDPIQRPRFDSPMVVSPGSSDQNTCWFIRSYIFERNDGEAPVLKRETVCTPSKANSLQRAKQRPARLVPLGR